MKSRIKKVAAINDMSGIGRCSLTIAIPILSALGAQCCPFPTAILSCQTAYEKFSFLDLTKEMNNYRKIWDGLNVKFDCIYSGFLGSEEQIEIVKDFIERHKEALIVIDPVMGDNGDIYSTYTVNMCNKIKKLVSYAHVITPNLTEACLLLDKKYNVGNISIEELKGIAKALSDLGPEKVIITGIIKGNEVLNIAYDKSANKYFKVVKQHCNRYYGGTGDTFASIVTGILLKGKGLEEAMEKAADFISKAIEYTAKYEVDPREGIIFEPFLRELIYEEK